MTKKILSFLVLILFISSCKKEEQLTFSEIEITTETNALVSVFIPQASTNSATGKTINNKIESFVASVLTIGNTDAVKTPLSITQQIDRFNKEYTSFITDFPEPSLAWEAQIDGEIMYQSDEIISMAITSYINTGGAHGNTTVSFLNFNATTGKQIENKTLFTNIETFKTIAKPFFEIEVKDKSVLFDPETFELPANIGFSEEGVILLYNTYEIAPYATGIIEFIIPFEKANTSLIFNGL